MLGSQNVTHNFFPQVLVLVVMFTFSPQKNATIFFMYFQSILQDWQFAKNIAQLSNLIAIKETKVS